MSLYIVESWVPASCTAVYATIAIRTTRNPYSTSEAPRSSSKTLMNVSLKCLNRNASLLVKSEGKTNSSVGDHMTVPNEAQDPFPLVSPNLIASMAA